MRTVSTIELNQLLSTINTRYGYDLRGYSQASIRRRVNVAFSKSGIANVAEFQSRIEDNPDFFGQVLSDLTVRVTEMFRDPEFYRVFRKRVVPTLRQYPSIKIWHAGCSTGEEVYSTAILLSEEGLYDRTQIYATDINVSAIRHATSGLYSDEQLDLLADRYYQSGGICQISNYYTMAYHRIAMKDSLKSNILFFDHNLVSDYVFGEMQVIFCRNVLIYFGTQLREKVMSMFEQSLIPGGYLCLGSSERPSRTTGAASFIELCRAAHIYRRIVTSP